MHLSPGRLRVVSEVIKGSDEVEQRVRTVLQRMQGVTSVRTSALTGSITVTYDQSVTTGYRILNALIAAGATSNVIPINAARKQIVTNAAAVGVLSPTQKKLLLKLAGTAIKLALPFIVERYLGKSAGKLVKQIV